MRETNFKQTEIGLIPYDWEVSKLGNVSNDIFYGIAARAVPYDGKVKYIRITDIDDRSREFSPTPLCSPEVYAEDYFVHPGDILFARTGSSVGKTYLYSQNDGNLVFAGFLIKVGITEACPEFIFYLTQTSSYWEWVAAQSVRTGQPGINAIQLSELPIPLPARSEQARIGRILKQLDGLISGLKKLIDKKRAIKDGAMSQLLSGKLRLNGYSERWQTILLNEVSEFANITMPCDVFDDSSYVCTENMKSDCGGIVTYRDIVPYTYSKSYMPFDILLSNIRPYLKKIWLADKSGCCSNDILTIRPNSELVSPHFLYYCLSQDCFFNYVMEGASGTKMPRGNKNHIARYEFEIPSDHEEQKAIAKVLTDMDDAISALEAKLKKYEQLKKGMMQQLLTGKIRLISPNESLS